MADNWLEKKFEDLKAGKSSVSKEDRARKDAWRKRMEAERKRLEQERMSVISRRFDVAGHVFEVTLPDTLPEDILDPYMPFLTESQDEPLFKLKLLMTDDLASVSKGRFKECFNDEPPYFWMFEKNGRYNFAFSYTKDKPDCLLMPSLEYTDNIVYICRKDAGRLAGFALSNALMLLYAFRTMEHETLMVHASVISYDGGGYMFLGKSGTGKSTHSRMWLQNIEGCTLLNDDNPVIRITEGKAYVYGTPWSGKTPCYKNLSVPLKAVVRLSQAPYNKVERLAPLKAYASLMPSCSCMRWDRKSTDRLHATVEKVIMNTGCWHLECLPDADAAHVCCSAVKC